jgi:glycosyltransferase involved in cell wall biosynthesis
MIALSDCVMVMLEAIPYRGLMQRHQHLAREFAYFLPVIYVEATPSRLRRLLDGHPFDPDLVAYKYGLQDLGNNISLYKAPPCAPRGAQYRRSIELTSRTTAKYLKPLLPSNRPVILWLFSPSAMPSIGLYNEALSVFDCFDAFGEFPNEARHKNEVLQALEETSKKADLVLATSDDLKDRLTAFNPHTMLVKNGCEPYHFASGGQIPSRDKLILDFDSLPKPVIGYMGDIAPWVDLDSLTLAAERHPEWSFVILGTWKRPKHHILDLPNVHSPGSVSYDELPYYARRFNVGTIPFVLTDLTRAVNPLKLYEYFSLGLPVVATALPEVVRQGDLVYISHNQDEFVNLLESAVREKPDSSLRPRRIALAKDNSWKSRAATVVDTLTKLLIDRDPVAAVKNN